MAKFSLIKRQRFITEETFLDGSGLTRKINFRSIKIDKSHKDAGREYLEAMIYYGNLMEMPYSLNIEGNEKGDVWALQYLLEDYFSRCKLLKPSDRDKRNTIYETIKPHIDFAAQKVDFLMIKEILKINSPSIKEINVDAVEIEESLNQ